MKNTSTKEKVIVICSLNNKPCKYQAPDDPDCSPWCERRVIREIIEYNKKFKWPTNYGEK